MSEQPREPGQDGGPERNSATGPGSAPPSVTSDAVPPSTDAVPPTTDEDSKTTDEEARTTDEEARTSDAVSKTTDAESKISDGDAATRDGGPWTSQGEPWAADDTPAGPGGDLSSASPVGRLAATVERLSREVRAAQAEAEGRALVELAKGVLVERLKCGPAQAARQLAQLAEQAQVTPLELAVDVINQAARDRMSEVTDAFLAATRAADEAETESAAVRLRAAESGVLAADDAQAVADALLEQALRPLGAVAVAIWAAGSDGSFTLAGSAGFSPAEAARWRYVPPDVVTVARRGLIEREGQWITTLGETGLPSIGLHHHPDGGRAALPAGTGGRIHGVLEIAWPAPLAPQPPQIVRQVEALAELCAHTLEMYAPPRGAAQEPRVLPDAAELMDLADGLHDPALVLVPHLDADGHLVDFRIQHVNSRFLDPAGRPRAVVNGALLLEAYPMAAGDSELFQRVERVYATGEPFRARRMNLTALVDQVPLSAVADISISRHGMSVLLIWRIEDEAARLASLLQHAQRLGRIGGFEENVLTGEITWNGQLFDLYGRPQTSTPVALEELPAHATTGGRRPLRSGCSGRTA
jgi:hypothetical protein